MIFNNFDLSDKKNLLENSSEYAALPYQRMCQSRANKAIVYVFEDIPVAEIYDNTGRISTRVAFLRGSWTSEIPQSMLFGDDIHCVSVRDFISLCKKAEKIATAQVASLAVRKYSLTVKPPSSPPRIPLVVQTIQSLQAVPTGENSTTLPVKTNRKTRITATTTKTLTKTTTTKVKTK